MYLLCFSDQVPGNARTSPDLAGRPPHGIFRWMARRTDRRRSHRRARRLGAPATARMVRDHRPNPGLNDGPAPEVGVRCPAAPRARRSARTSRARRGSCPRTSRARTPTTRSAEIRPTVSNSWVTRVPFAIWLEYGARPTSEDPAAEPGDEASRRFDLEDLGRALHRAEVDDVGRSGLVDRPRDVGDAGDAADPFAHAREVRPEREHLLRRRCDVGGERCSGPRSARLCAGRHVGGSS